MSFHRAAGIFSYIFFTVPVHTWAQQSGAHAPDSLLEVHDLAEMVVTATRSERKITDVPIPVVVIGQEQVQSSGASRLDDILSEQTGLAIIVDHGTGVQVQGMDPEYCLILVNGEPLIGRTAGTLDLTRISLGDVERIEVMKGPSSSLYGSEALAGVINIITRPPRQNALHVQARYGGNGTTDHTLGGSLRLGTRGAASLSFNHFHTDGYDLMPQTYGRTVDPYRDYTIQGDLRYRLSTRLQLQVSGRYFAERQRNDYLAMESGDSILVGGHGEVLDRQVNPLILYTLSARWTMKLRSYLSWYGTQSDLRDRKADTVYDDAYFRQAMWKEELQSETKLSATQILTAGMGFTMESVTATRYTKKERLSDYYAYVQHEWHPSARWNLLTGLRYDMPSAYHAQLSPKVAAQYRAGAHWSVQASVGVGYKAPDFRQQYLSFSNPVVGYSVLGAQSLRDGLAKMQREGQIAQLYVDPADMPEDLRPETSVAYNLGGRYEGRGDWQLSVNIFRNDVRNLIDTRTIAMKTNGQPLYSYYNIHRVYTEGIEADGSLPLLHNALVIRAGYQFLIARDRQVVGDIRAGKAFTRDPGTLETRRLHMGDYGGLFNRSRHSFNLKAYYTRGTWTLNGRLLYRGKFGFADTNGDNILDDPAEYAPGYVLCHINLGKSCWKQRLHLQAGIRNIFNYTDPAHLPSLPGRTAYAGLSLNLYSSNDSTSKR